jgi:seryl-tRNA synthetase
MLDIRYIRDHADEVKQNCAFRNANIDVDALLELDRSRLKSIQEVEDIRKERNEVSAHMPSASDEQRAGLMERGRELKELLAVKEAELAETEQQWTDLMLRIPNRSHPEVRKGETDEENAEVRRYLEPVRIENAKDHTELAKELDLLDFERGAGVVGAKFPFIKGRLAILEQSLIRFALDQAMEYGFLPMSTPDLAKDAVIVGAGFSPRGDESQIYSIENSDLSLIGTSEITLAGYHQNETFNAASLPIRYAGISHCYRTEAGAYGRESYGLYRIHQFSKVELFIFAAPEQSDALLEELVRVEEEIWKKLEIPYRVVDICAGDLGAPAYRKYDIEAWMPGKSDGHGGRGSYGEVTSATNCTDYQARRLGIKMKSADGKTAFAHTLNGTAIATSRAMIAIMENGQTEDGSIDVPNVLVPYCGFAKLAPAPSKE